MESYLLSRLFHVKVMRKEKIRGTLNFIISHAFCIFDQTRVEQLHPIPDLVSFSHSARQCRLISLSHISRGKSAVAPECLNAPLSL